MPTARETRLFDKIREALLARPKRDAAVTPFKG